MRVALCVLLVLGPVTGSAQWPPWAMWQDLGGDFVYVPSCPSWGPHRIDCFARGSGGSLVHRWWTGYDWAGWEDLGGSFASAPACISRGENLLDCFARGNTGTLAHRSWTGTQWTPWEDLAGSISSAPDCVASSPFRIDCFAKTAAGTMTHRAWTGTWSAWEDLGGALGGGPSCISWGAGRIDCFARSIAFLAAPSQLLHRAWNGNSWEAWEALGGALASDPECLSWAPGRIDCFAEGTSKTLVHRAWSGAWTAWEDLGGTIQSAPSCTSRSPGLLDCYARSTTGTMHHRAYETTWRAWEDLGGAMATGPKCVSWDRDRTDCFARNAAEHLVHRAWARPDQARSFAITTWNGNCAGAERTWWDDMCMAWRNRMKDNGWDVWWNNFQLVQNPKFADPVRETWGVDNGSSGVDWAAAALLCTHGGHSSTVGWQGSMHTDVGHGCTIGENQMLLGSIRSGRLRFLHLSSCNSVRWEERTRWFGAADGGVHVITGFHGFMYIGESYVDEYESVAADAFSSSGVGNEWVDHMYHVSHWYNGWDTVCPVSLGFGSSLGNASAANNERYVSHWPDQRANWMNAIYWSGCDPDDAGPLP